MSETSTLAPGATRLTVAAAANLASWHEASFAALGLAWARRRDAWLAIEPGPRILFDAVALQPPNGDDDRARLGELLGSALPAGRPVSVSDPWRVLGGHGLSPGEEQAWMWRAPAATIGSTSRFEVPSGARISEARSRQEIETWEATSVAGFEAEPVAPGTYHPAAIVEDPRARFWLAHLDGRPAATATAFVAAGVVGIYNVATFPWARRLGLASALTAVAAASAVRLPAVLQPSLSGESLYSRLGFEQFATFATWLREESR